MVFETEEQIITWLKVSDKEDLNNKIISIMELSSIYEDVHQAIETLSCFYNLSKKEWLKLYDENCMHY